MTVEVRKLAKGEFESLGIGRWSTWGCGVSSFPWTYDEPETCYILEGEVEVTCKGGAVTFGPGDFVAFPAGLSCTWNVKKAVKKHYRFG